MHRAVVTLETYAKVITLGLPVSYVYEWRAACGAIIRLRSRLEPESGSDQCSAPRLEVRVFKSIRQCRLQWNGEFRANFAKDRLAQVPRGIGRRPMFSVRAFQFAGMVAGNRRRRRFTNVMSLATLCFGEARATWPSGLIRYAASRLSPAFSATSVHEKT